MKVVIVGAGPAGLITALNLLQRGLKPLVLEKQPEVRSTACGEALGLCWLDEIPFDSSPHIAKRVTGARLIFPGGNFDHIPKDSAVLNRTEWLRGMAEEVERKGGQLLLNSEVTGVAGSHIRLKDGREIGYDVLIGADGPTSRLARRLGISHRTIVASQYKITIDTSGMDSLEFYFDKRFSFGYAWIFPKEGTANVGVGGDFAHLDAFLQYKGLDRQPILEKEAGVIPSSGVNGCLARQKIALIGDAASMPNPAGLSGLSSIIQASRLLADNIENLENYQRQVKSHPMADPALLRGGRIMIDLGNRDLTYIGKFFAGVKQGEGHAPRVTRIIKYPRLLLKLNKLRKVYRAGKMAMDYGW
ncbi:MAG: NAD(P)/FAD-dependent oxidoreductase [Dehalococcoidales bacterium]|nr:NAD(P)/FAD-dependent oxidoreductase [Dehalococcoidales bacterium]